MPEGARGPPATLDELVGSGFARRIEAAAAAVRASSGTLRVLVDSDADGLSAGGILVRALSRAGKRVHLTAVRGMEKADAAALAAERPPVLILSDLGSGQADLLEPIADAGTLVVILDHHVPISKRDDTRFLQINGHLHGVDGTSQLCGASTSFLFALALDYANFDLVALAISGAIGDRQHVGGFRGAALRIVEAGERGGYLRAHRGLNLDGADMVDALVSSNDPFLPGVTGDEEAARRLLRETGIRPDSKVGEVQDAQARALASRLVLLLLESGVAPNYAEEVTTLRIELDGQSGGGMTAKDLQRRGLHRHRRRPWRCGGLRARAQDRARLPPPGACGAACARGKPAEENARGAGVRHRQPARRCGRRRPRRDLPLRPRVPGRKFHAGGRRRLEGLDARDTRAGRARRGLLLRRAQGRRGRGRARRRPPRRVGRDDPEGGAREVPRSARCDGGRADRKRHSIERRVGHGLRRPFSQRPRVESRGE
jgi:hypothetical protein